MRTSNSSPRPTASRRQFLGQAAAAVTAAGWLGVSFGRPSLGEEAGKPSPAAIPIVDTHQHLWDLSRIRLPWLESAGALNRSFVTKDYLEAAAGTSIIKTVYMEVDTAPESKQAEADYVLEICRRGDTPMVAAVIGGNPAGDGFARYIQQYQNSPYIKGVREIVRRAETFSDGKFRRGVQRLGELGMSFDLCQPPDMLPEAARFVDACPGVRFILDHCGNADVKAFLPPAKDEPAEQVAARRQRCDRWRRDMAALGRRENVVCKISGIIASAVPESWRPEQLAPIVDHCLDVFGPQRVMFAGDWPVCTRVASLRQWVDALKQIVRDRSDADRRRLFHDNAMRFYGLRP